MADGQVSGKNNHESLSTTALTNNQLSGFGYDAYGNMTSNSPYTYVYDGENRLIAAGGMSYIYDGDGLRVEKCTQEITPALVRPILAAQCTGVALLQTCMPS